MLLVYFAINVSLHALKTGDVSILVCADDKHRIKVGEPSCPVEAEPISTLTSLKKVIEQQEV